MLSIGRLIRTTDGSPVSEQREAHEVSVFPSGTDLIQHQGLAAFAGQYQQFEDRVPVAMKDVRSGFGNG